MILRFVFFRRFISTKLFILRCLSARRGLLFMSAYYWVYKMDHVVSSLIPSPSFLWILSGQKPRALWKPAMWHLAASAPSEGQRGPRCTFHGDAEKQRFTQHPAAGLLQRASGWCPRVRLRASSSRTTAAGAGGDVRAHVSPEVKTTKPQVSYEQKDFPLDERVQTLRWETRQTSRRSVWHKEQTAILFKWGLFINAPFNDSYAANGGNYLIFSPFLVQEVRRLLMKLQSDMKQEDKHTLAQCFRLTWLVRTLER